LGHLLTRSGVTHPEVTSIALIGSFATKKPIVYLKQLVRLEKNAFFTRKTSTHRVIEHFLFICDLTP
jgi:hypothetical protein